MRQRRHRDRELPSRHPGELGHGVRHPCRRQSRLDPGAHQWLRARRPLQPAPGLWRCLRGHQRYPRDNGRSGPAPGPRCGLRNRLHHRPVRRVRRSHGHRRQATHRPGPGHRRRPVRIRVQLHGAAYPGLPAVGTGGAALRFASARSHAQYALHHGRRALHTHHGRLAEYFQATGRGHGPARAA
ncbi:hypothetical protein D3C72_1606650 [compost metagenome]